MIASLHLTSDPEELAAELEGLVRRNLVQLRRNPRAPRLYASGVVYAPEVGAAEDWLSVLQALRAGRADCEDLTAWRVAELRMAGVHARPQVIRTGPSMLHARVLLPDGSVEDPSRRLGM